MKIVKPLDLGAAMNRDATLVLRRSGVHVFDHRSTPRHVTELFVVLSRFTVRDERRHRLEQPGPRSAAVQESLDVGQFILKDLAKAWKQVVWLPELRHANTIPHSQASIADAGTGAASRSNTVTS